MSWADLSSIEDRRRDPRTEYNFLFISPVSIRVPVSLPDEVEGMESSQVIQIKLHVSVANQA